MKSIRTLYSLRKEIAVEPLGQLFVKKLLFILGNFFLNENDVEFDLRGSSYDE